MRYGTVLVFTCAIVWGARLTESADTFKNSIGIEFKRIEPGSFAMGSKQASNMARTDRQPARTSRKNGPANRQPARNDERPSHTVEFSAPYYIGVYEVTEAQWTQVMGGNKGSSNEPVTGISWYDAQSFCTKLSATPAESAGQRTYRLPTEAEWEYACRAGSETAYHFGDDPSLLSNFAWHAENSVAKKQPVGQKKPNAWGLYDMAGNAYEWCNDTYGTYPSELSKSPDGRPDTIYRVLRGGSWESTPWFCRSADRCWNNPAARCDINGFRIVVNAQGK